MQATIRTAPAHKACMAAMAASLPSTAPTAVKSAVGNDDAFAAGIQLHAGEDLHKRPILELRPTQLAVGMQQVGAKQALLLKKGLDQKPAKLEQFLKDHPMPGVLGPAGAFYLVDHHHLARALLSIGAVSVLCAVVEDWSAETPESFWQRMDEKGYLWCYSATGMPLSRQEFLASLPKSVEGLLDDPYRSLAGLIRRAGAYKKVTVPFSEFKWANWLRVHMPGLHAVQESRRSAVAAAGAATEALRRDTSAAINTAIIPAQQLGTATADGVVDHRTVTVPVDPPWPRCPDHPAVLAQAMALAASPEAAGLPGYCRGMLGADEESQAKA